MEIKTKNGGGRLSWHPAFFEAIQMELDEYSEHLQFIHEHQLTTEPLRIDVLIIKKSGHIPIRKNIAVIFREWNLLEYKSPGGYVSVEDFYKVYGYACLYAFINKVPMNSLTISFVESRYPRKLVMHLQNERGYAVAETSPGIYTIKGDVLPIQIIDSRKLSVEENLWLKSLNCGHNGVTIARLNREIDRKDRPARLRAYLYTIISANKEAAKEASEMGNKFDEFVEETGLAAKWEARTRADVARNALAEGASPDFVRKITGLPLETIASLNKKVKSKK